MHLGPGMAGVPEGPRTTAQEIEAALVGCILFKDSAGGVATGDGLAREEDIM